MTFRVSVGISNHHVHLTEEVYQKLFHSPYEKIKDLTQKGEFATDKMVTLEGPHGKIERVRFLGPFRSYNQVEITATDAHLLGINPPVRKSNDLQNSEKITLIGDDGQVTLENACILAECHIHMNQDDLKKYGVEDNEIVKVHVGQKRKGIMYAHIKASENGVLDFHVDRDEANAFLLTDKDEVIVEKCQEEDLL